MTSPKTYSEKEYKRHGDSLYEIGKESAFQSVLKTQVKWSVKMTDDNWDLDTVIIGDGSLKNIPFIKSFLIFDKDENGDFIRKHVITKAKDGTVKEVWLAADRAFRKARRLYGDWHYFLEIVELKTDSCRRKNGYIASFYGS